VQKCGAGTPEPKEKDRGGRYGHFDRIAMAGVLDAKQQ